ncbi:hypothetical protein ACOME3_000366 [Neoechinorhynchus agilis]
MSFFCGKSVFKYADDMSRINDYAVILKPYKFTTATNGNQLEINTECVQFMCLNARSAFRAFHSVHCVIVSSGTLAPLNALENEIGLKFEVKAETDHVVPASQMFVATVDSVSNGSSNPLRCTYAQSSSFAFQDDLGHLIVDICQRVTQGGILCFLPSYRLLETLRIRWTASGIWEHLESNRRVLVEPRADRAFSLMLCQMKSNSEFLLFAVFRGRASEGIDFADDMARCVVCVGLPYPNIKELGIDLKKKYNDRQRGLLLPGGNKRKEFYIYRALNQALGRCLRHRNDWGSIVLVDERFTTGWQRYGSYVSSWIRNKVKFYKRRSDQFLNDLEDFNKLQYASNGEQSVKSFWSDETIKKEESKAFLSLFKEKRYSKKAKKPKNTSARRNPKIPTAVPETPFEVSINEALIPSSAELHGFEGFDNLKSVKVEQAQGNNRLKFGNDSDSDGADFVN